MAEHKECRVTCGMELWECVNGLVCWKVEPTQELCMDKTHVLGRLCNYSIPSFLSPK